MSDIVSRARAALDGESAFTDPLDDLVRDLCEEVERTRAERDRDCAELVRLRGDNERLREALSRERGETDHMHADLDTARRALDDLSDAWRKAEASNDQKRDAIERVRNLHEHVTEPYYKGMDQKPFHVRDVCEHCEVRWPCPTIRAIDGDDDA